MFVCIFTITTYGTSGNELPPPAVSEYSRAVLSGQETEAAFRKRMQGEGMLIRDILKDGFEETPKPYSCADSCSWAIYPIGSITEVAREAIRRT